MACFGSDTSFLLEALLLSCPKPFKRKASACFASADSLAFKRRPRATDSADEDVVHLDFCDEETVEEITEIVDVPLDVPQDVVYVVKPFDEKTVESKLTEICSSSPFLDCRRIYQDIVHRRTDEKHATWTTKYAPRKMEHVLGNLDALETLRCWLREWKRFIAKNAETEQRTETSKDSTRKRASRPIDSDSSDSEDSYGSPVPEEMNIVAYMVYGPSGCGKTAAIHALAEELDFTILEINPASSHDAKQILTNSLEATRSHRIGPCAKKNGIRSFFHTEKPQAEVPKPDARSNTLILIDDADVLPDGEESFLVAVESMLKKTKRPVIFTVSGVSKIRLIQAESMDIGDIDFVRQPSADLVGYVRLLALAESVHLDQSTACDIVRSTKGDLRSSINLAQFKAEKRLVSATEVNIDASVLFLEEFSKTEIHISSCLQARKADGYHSQASSSTSGESVDHASTDETTDSGFSDAEFAETVDEDVVHVLSDILCLVCGLDASDQFKSADVSPPESNLDSPCKQEDASRAASPEVPVSFSPLLELNRKEVLHELWKRDSHSILDLINALPSAKTDHHAFWKVVPLTGVSDTPSDQPTTVEERVDEDVEQTDLRLAMVQLCSGILENDFERPADRLEHEAHMTGRSLFNRYGQYNPQLHVSGSRFGADHWTFIRQIARSELARRKEEELTKRRRQRFYNYLSADRLHLDDDLIERLAYEIGDSVPVREGVL